MHRKMEERLGGKMMKNMIAEHRTVAILKLHYSHSLTLIVQGIKNLLSKSFTPLILVLV